GWAASEVVAPKLPANRVACQTGSDSAHASCIPLVSCGRERGRPRPRGSPTTRCRPRLSSRLPCERVTRQASMTARPRAARGRFSRKPLRSTEVRRCRGAAGALIALLAGPLVVEAADPAAARQLRLALARIVRRWLAYASS